MNEVKLLGFEASDLLIWLGGVRWFGGGEPKIDHVFALGGPWDEKVLQLAISADSREYNILVVVTEDGLVNTAKHTAGQRALLTLATASERVEMTSVIGESGVRLTSEPHAADATVVSAYKLVGGRPNAPVTYELTDSTWAIVEVSRMLNPGGNSDVSPTGAFSDSGTVPYLFDNVRMAWTG